MPGYTADGWSTRMFSESGFLDADKPIRDYTDAELHDFLYKEPTKVRISGINLTYEGLVPRIQKSMLSKDVDALQPHLRAFVERAREQVVRVGAEGVRAVDGEIRPVAEARVRTMGHDDLAPADAVGRVVVAE